MSSHNPLSEIMVMNVEYNNLSRFKNSGSGLNAQKKQTTDIVDAYCNLCQNSGHTRDEYFYIHDYPEWHRLHGKPKSKTKILSTPGVKFAAQIIAGNNATTGSQVQMDNTIKDSMKVSSTIQDDSRNSQTERKLEYNVAAPQMSGIDCYTKDFNKFSCSIVFVHSVSSPNNYAYYTWILDSGATNHNLSQRHVI